MSCPSPTDRLRQRVNNGDIGCLSDFETWLRESCCVPYRQTDIIIFTVIWQYVCGLNHLYLDCHDVWCWLGDGNIWRDFTIGLGHLSHSDYYLAGVYLHDANDRLHGDGTSGASLSKVSLRKGISIKLLFSALLFKNKWEETNNGTSINVHRW